jgi:hypothetical protein
VLGSVADVPANSHRFVEPEKLLQCFRGERARVPQPIPQVVAVLEIGVEEIVFLFRVFRLCLRTANPVNEPMPSLQTLILPSPAPVLVRTPTKAIASLSHERVVLG